MTIDELLSLAGLTANDEIPVWDAEAVDEPTKKITAQNLAASVKALAGLVGEEEFTEALADKADKADVEELTAQLADKASAIVDTASGAIASFPDGMAAPAKDVTIGIEPMQDLHGQDAPYPAGGGKNLFNKDGNLTSGYFWNANNADLTPNQNYYVTDYIPVSGSNVKVSGNTMGYVGTSGSVGMGCFDSNKDAIRSTNTTVLDISGASYIRLSVYKNDLNTFQCEYGTIATSYAPYSNICPISGWTGARIVVADVAPNAEGVYTIASVQTGSGDPSPTNIRPILPGLSFERDDSTTMDVYGGTLDVTTGLLTVTMAEVDMGTLNWNAGGAQLKLFYSVISDIKQYSDALSDRFINKPTTAVNNLQTGEMSTAENGRIYVYNGGMWADAAAFKTAMSGAQLVYELTTPQTYQLTHTEVQRAMNALGITSTTYDITFPTEAGTVYGGTLDVTTGLLTVTHGYVDMGTLNWRRHVDANYPYFFANGVGNKGVSSQWVVPYFISSMYLAARRFSVTNEDINYIIATDTSSNLYVRNDSYTDAATFKAAMSGVQLVYELATPQTYQLTPTEVEMLLGDNNVWADTGDSTVAYRADTKLYIQKINAPTDDDMIADAQIASGKYFIIGGNLYKSTTTIPAGDIITPGSNCILTNLADALNALNT